MRRLYLLRERSKQTAARSGDDVCVYFEPLRAVGCAARFCCAKEASRRLHEVATTYVYTSIR